MPTNPLVGLLTPQIRQALYVGYFMLLLIAGGLEIALDPDPYWLNKGQEVLAYLGGALALTAASNIAKADPQPGPDVTENRANGL